MDKNFKIAIGIGIIAILSFFYFGGTTQFEIQELSSGIPFHLSEEIEKKATLVINNGEKVRNFNLRVTNETSVFDLLKGSGLKFNYEEYSAGIFINSIGGVANNSEKGKFWIYYVNGQQAEKAVDKKSVKANDKVMFKYESSPFK